MVKLIVYLLSQFFTFLLSFAKFCIVYFMGFVQWYFYKITSASLLKPRLVPWATADRRIAGPTLQVNSLQRRYCFVWCWMPTSGSVAMCTHNCYWFARKLNISSMTGQVKWLEWFLWPCQSVHVKIYVKFVVQPTSQIMCRRAAQLFLIMWTYLQSLLSLNNKQLVIKEYNAMVSEY